MLKKIIKYSKMFILDDYLLEIEPFRKANDTMTNDMGKKMYFNIETQTKNKNRQTQMKNLLEQIQKT